MTQILGLSGKKQAGKSASTNFLFGLEMLNLEMVNTMRIDTKGHLCVPIEGEDGEIKEGCLDPCDTRPEVQAMFAQTVWPFLKVYQLADPLKWICMNVLGLTWEQCNGSNAEKDSETKLRWEDMPGIMTPLQVDELTQNIRTPLGNEENTLTYPMTLDPGGPDKSGKQDSVMRPYGIQAHTEGRMTGREVMQYVGTDIFRKMIDDCWVAATLRIIEQEGPETAVIPDVRFPNEVEGIQKAGGKVVRFTRAPFAGQDEHTSETALDGYDGFDFVIDNANMTITEQNAALYEKLVEWGMLKTQIEAAQ